jgi:Leucine-rich repeat (LRR) protein
MSENSNQKEIIISKKDIKFVTVNMLNLQLLHIDVSNNKIIYLPDEICLLSKLVTLKVEHNNLKFLPDDIGNLKHLKVLSAKSNDLRRLPVSL